MSTAGMDLGVDFGTSNTVAVLRWSDGRARPLLFDGSPLLPSAVYAEPTGALVVGRDAVHSARMDPGRFEPNPKRRIDDNALLLGDREVPLVDAVTAVLSRVAEELRRTAGTSPVEAMLTFPASWGATRRLVLADAALAAGLGTVRLVPEPVAAATYFTQVLGRDVPIGSVVVVHDFGAGTIDVSVVARTSTGFEVLAVDGRDDIGGLDVDAAVVDLIGTVCAEHDAQTWERLTNPSTVEERRARRLLWDDARGAKERLSRHPTADITVPLLNLDVHVTRPELEERARPLLDQTVRVTQGVMRWANLAEGRVAGVFLVGGSSRIPLVATLLHRALGEAPVAIEQPELVVAEGSLLAAGAAVPGGGVGVPATRPVSPVAVSISPVPGSPAAGSPVAGSPVAGSPVAGSPAPVSSGAPAGSAPVPGRGAPAPVSPAGRMVGRVSVPGAAPPGRPSRSAPVAPTAPMPRPDSLTAPMPRPDPLTAPVPGPDPLTPRTTRDNAPAAPKPPTYHPGTAAPQPPARPAEPARAAHPEPAPAAAGYRPPRGRSGIGRAFRTFLLLVILVTVPVMAAVITYMFTTKQLPWPPQ